MLNIVGVKIYVLYNQTIFALFWANRIKNSVCTYSTKCDILRNRLLLLFEIREILIVVLNT
jgi:hypothetical protein